MNKLVLYLFLFTYSTVMFKPVVPYISDAMAHLLFYKDHMLTVHSHNGKFHVHAEVAEAAKNEHSEKSTDSLSKKTSGHEHIFTEAITFPVLKFSFNFPPSFSFSVKHASIKHDFPPPRV